MTCRELADFVSAYLADELGAEERARFEEHLAACPECVTYLASFEETIGLAKGAFRDPDAPVPPDIPEALVRAIVAARKKP